MFLDVGCRGHFQSPAISTLILKKNEEDVQVIKQKMTNVKAQMSNQAQNLNDKILEFWHWDLNWNLDF
jgi:hypothetical protein